MELSTLIPRDVLRSVVPSVCLKGALEMHEALAAQLNQGSKRYRFVSMNNNSPVTKQRSKHKGPKGFFPTNDQIEPKFKLPAVVVVLITPQMQQMDKSLMGSFDFLR
jgi:hypothetical protein